MSSNEFLASATEYAKKKRREDAKKAKALLALRNEKLPEEKSKKEIDQKED